MELKRFFTTEPGRIIMSVILGLGLATLFKKTCDGVNCMVFKAPSLEDIKNKKYKYGNKCFKYEMDAVACDDNKTIIDFA